jgi:hypothetical protein
MVGPIVDPTGSFCSIRAIGDIGDRISQGLYFRFGSIVLKKSEVSPGEIR